MPGRLERRRCARCVRPRRDTRDRARRGTPRSRRCGRRRRRPAFGTRARRRAGRARPARWAIVEMLRKRRRETRTPRSWRGVLRHDPSGLPRSSWREVDSRTSSPRCPRFAFAAGAGGSRSDWRCFATAAAGTFLAPSLPRTATTARPRRAARRRRRSPLSLGTGVQPVRHGGSRARRRRSTAVRAAARRDDRAGPRPAMPHANARRRGRRSGRRRRGDGRLLASSPAAPHRRGFGGASDLEIIAASTQVDDAARRARP